MELDTTRLKFEDWMALVGGLVLIGSVFLSWYTLEGHRVSGWDATKLTWVPLVVGILILVVELALAMGVVFPRSEGFLIAGCGAVAGLVAIVRVFVKHPGLKADYGIYLALAASMMLVFVGLRKLARSYMW